MVTNPKSIICKSCAKTIATVSETGLVPCEVALDAQRCETCSQFWPLYDAKEAADEAYAAFNGRRDNYKPKQDALLKFRTAHMDLDNWLMGTEAKNTNMPHSTQWEDEARLIKEDVQQGTKRSMSQSPTAEKSSPILPKGCRNTSFLPKPKRLKFSESVEFREHYRSSNHYSRTDKAYVPGRYAPRTDGEHLDTSGCQKTFVKFTGVKKVGKRWINVWNEHESENEDNKKTSKDTVVGTVDATGSG
ncbi:hypothetical protein GQ44DRAFT_768800 [Phaeosphaeriaceae sp. PMI808]|nr:hypothetical protein GQ44DRAFT_768800 [Phaeosphaeriaceae sp. PMI808]